VYVIQNNFAHMRSIKAGVTDGGLTQVTGIGPADVVANSSFDKLQDNIAVVVSNKPAAAGTSSNNTGSNAP
jgi:multidrug efflux system membrane fusion protein